jgi:hypothetical protein
LLAEESRRDDPPKTVPGGAMSHWRIVLDSRQKSINRIVAYRQPQEGSWKTVDASLDGAEPAFGAVMDLLPIREPLGTVPILRSPRSKMGLSPSPGRFSDRLLLPKCMTVPSKA